MNPDHDFSVFSQRWLMEKRDLVKPTSISTYKISVDKYLNPWFKSVHDITGETVNKFIDEKIKEGLSVKRVKDILMVLKMIARYCKSKGVDVNWDLKITLPQKGIYKDMQVLTGNQQKVLVDYLCGNITDKNLGILLCLCTGLRIGEICGLKWKDINMQSSMIYVNKTVCRLNLDEGSPKRKTAVIISSPKTIHSVRTVPLPSPLHTIVCGMAESRDKEFYVISNSTHPCEPRSYRYYFKKVLERCGLPYVKFHCLRHSFATRCIEINADYKTVSAILGHADISTTLNMYVHPSMDQKRRCIDSMLASLES